jgi:hypothetical protein
MNFLLTTNSLSVPPAHVQQVKRAKRGIWRKECQSESSVLFLSVYLERILQLFINFYLRRKFPIFLTNDHDCKAVGAPNIFEKLS